MLIDISGSMASDGKIEGAIAAALSLGHYMRTKHRQDKLTIIAYDDRTRIVPFEYVHGLRPNGGTSTEIALARARDILADDRKRDGLVYLITDGQPNQPELAIEEAHGLREDGVKFIEVLLDDRYSYMYGGQNGGVGIGRRMAKAAGGLFIHVKDPAKIGAFFLEQYAVAKGRKRL
jgi:Mg-chelatase subunit ChlD